LILSFSIPDDTVPGRDGSSYLLNLLYPYNKSLSLFAGPGVEKPRRAQTI
jgi:hypothetical protein